VIVRVATEADARAMARVHVEWAAAAYAELDLPPEPDPIGRRVANWQAVFGSEDMSPFVAEVDASVVGILNVGSARDRQDVGELYVLYVHPTYWGRGAGQALIETAHTTLEKRFSEAVLTVLAQNPRARRFYERNGWAVEAIVTEPHFGGRATEVARYRKQFS
jgi:ribosomal protein S18 acetylase RimI-like enzyme